MIDEKCGKIEELNQHLLKQEAELASIYTKFAIKIVGFVKYY